MRIRAYYHPLLVMLIPAALGILFSAAVAATDVSWQQVPRILAGIVWISLFSSGTIGCAYHWLSAKRLLVKYDPDIRSLEKLPDKEYSELKLWLATGSMSAIKGRLVNGSPH